MSGTQLGLIGGGIKSIQRGQLSIGSGAGDAAATISAVDTTKTELRFLGSYTAFNPPIEPVAVYLSSSTTVGAQRLNVTATTLNVSWELTEWY